MLFIDGRRQIRSLEVRHIPVPFVRERFRHDLARVHALLAPYRHDPAFIQAVATELRRCLGTPPRARPYPQGLIEVGEQAIADGLIGVATALPAAVAVTFDGAAPSELDRLSAVMFASPNVAIEFLCTACKTTDNQAAFAAALGDPAGRRHVNIAPIQETAEQASRLPEAAAVLARRSAALLARRYLALLPRDPSRERLRLVWIEHSVPKLIAAGSSAPAAPSPRAAPPPPPPAPRAPMSVLPDPPAELTPQARTLIEAAKNGTPFCEECARRAAELAGV